MKINLVKASLMYGSSKIVERNNKNNEITLILGLLQNVENLGVFWINAHCDINTEITSFSKNTHGIPVDFAMGLREKNL